MNIYEKLIEVRKAVPYLKKDTHGYEYEYVSGSSVLGGIKKTMDELGLLLIPSVTEYEVETEVKQITYRDKANKERTKESKSITVKCYMTMTWVNAEKPEETIAVPFACFGTQNDISKAFGSALTYTERYFLLKFFNIPTDDIDPDAFQKKLEGDNGKKKIGKKPVKSAMTKSKVGKNGEKVILANDIIKESIKRAVKIFDEDTQDKVLDEIEQDDFTQKLAEQTLHALEHPKGELATHIVKKPKNTMYDLAVKLNKSHVFTQGEKDGHKLLIDGGDGQNCHTLVGDMQTDIKERKEIEGKVNEKMGLKKTNKQDAKLLRALHYYRNDPELIDRLINTLDFGAETDELVALIPKLAQGK